MYTNSFHARKTQQNIEANNLILRIYVQSQYVACNEMIASIQNTKLQFLKPRQNIVLHAKKDKLAHMSFYLQKKKENILASTQI